MFSTILYDLSRLSALQRARQGDTSQAQSQEEEERMPANPFKPIAVRAVTMHVRKYFNVVNTLKLYIIHVRTYNTYLH